MKMRYQHKITGHEVTSEKNPGENWILIEAKKAWRYWNNNNPIFYVSSLPGHDGADWGYSQKAHQAILLNKYWQRRFFADCRRVNTETHLF
jgi:hypothetical protein